jgi:hypothetical protein
MHPARRTLDRDRRERGGDCAFSRACNLLVQRDVIRRKSAESERVSYRSVERRERLNDRRRPGRFLWIR